MTIFKEILSYAAVLDLDNIDTDMIIPQKYIKGISREGLGKHLFAYKRYYQDSLNPDFILNKQPFDKAEILIGNKNFGCGSSREHAVWAIKDFGIKVIIAESFADIFYENCIKNLILPAIVEHKALKHIKYAAQQNNKILVNLEHKKISVLSSSFPFEIDEFKKEIILNQKDEITFILGFLNEIYLFESEQQQRMPWLWTNNITK